MKKKGSRTGQATLFVILGIVLIAVFSFTLYARSLIITDEMKAQAELILTDAIQSNSINYYVENCLDQVATEALYRIGEQGGMLDLSGKQPWKDYFMLNDSGKEYRVAYAIKPNEKCDEVALDPPQYPRDRTKLSELPNTYKNSLCKNDGISGFFGESTLPRLCYLFGPNAFQKTPGYLDLACRGLAYGVMTDTMQHQLQAYVTEQLRECVNFTQFTEVLGHNITVQESKMNTSVIYGLESVTIDATYPFKVRIGGRGVTAMQEFTHVSPVRLRLVYEFIMDLIQQDNNHHNFNLSRDYKQVQGYDPSLNFTLLQDKCVDHEQCLDDPLNDDYSEFDDVIRVVDDHVKINNESFMFQVAIRNRAPALDYFHEAFAGSEYDVKRGENETITLTPKGYDPDDMRVTYDYSGWREDYATYLDYDCCALLPEGKCTLTNHKECTFPLLDELTGQPVIPNNWTKSPIYQGTHRDATINLTTNDTGIHNVTITVYDDTGLYDYQLIRILVFDLPHAEANGTNNFDEINDTYASIEDPYALDGTGSRASTIMDDDLEYYSWKGYEDTGIGYQETFLLFVAEAFYTTPTDDPEWQPRTFFDRSETTNIVNLPLNTSLGNNIPPGGIPYQLELVVASDNHDWSEPSTMDVQLYECLPNRGDGSLAYPYNTSSLYTYNHSCCLGTTIAGEPASADWGTIASENNPCYTRTIFGRLGYLYGADDYYGQPRITPLSHERPAQLGIGSSTHPPGSSFPDVSVLLFDKELENDIFERAVVRNCDGERGNTCTGDMTTTYTQVTSCPDYLTPTQTQRCTGPGNEWRETPGSCATYGFPNTFETAHNIQHDKNNVQITTAVCEPFERCASKGTTNYDPNRAYAPINEPSGHGIFRCRGGCDSTTGECTLAIGCFCDERCGATCESNADNSSLDTNDICNYNCDITTTCDFASQETCTEHLLCDDIAPNIGPNPAYWPNFNWGGCGETPFKTRNPDIIQQCYYGRDCTANGCNYQHRTELDQYECDYCDDTGAHQGNYCPPPGHFDTNNNILYTYPTTRNCNNGNCEGLVPVSLNNYVTTTCPDPNPLDDISMGAKPVAGVFVCCQDTDPECILP